MAIKRYFANEDNIITNAFKSDLTTRATGSNMGQADILEVFSIYAQATETSRELARTLIKFPIEDIASDRTSGLIEKSGSVKFFLKMCHAEHPFTLPRDYTLAVLPVSGAWQEGVGIDTELYRDSTNNFTGSNWVMANSSRVHADGKITFNSNTATDYNDDTIVIKDNAGLQKTYTFDSDSSFNVANSPTIGINGDNSAATIAQRVSASIGASGGHNDSIDVFIDGAVLTLHQKKPGRHGNNTITTSDSTNIAVVGFGNGNGEWASNGGDFYNTSSATNPNYSQHFPIGNENLEIDISYLVEQWIAGTKNNDGLLIKLLDTFESGSLNSYYTKQFYSRGTQFFYKRPHIEARWDNATKDNRGNFFFSSSLNHNDDNLNTIYLYNYVRGQLRNIPEIHGATNAGAAYADGKIAVMIFSGSGDDTAPDGPALKLASGDFVRSGVPHVVTGGWVDTGIYTASFAFSGSTDLETIYDLWFKANDSYGFHAPPNPQYHTGTITPYTFNAYGYKPNNNYVISMPNLKKIYSNRQTERFRLHVRPKNWSPTIYSKASETIPTELIESASYTVCRVTDNLTVIDYGTSSASGFCTELSYDVSGNYFDLDLSMLQTGYTYAFKFSFYDDFVSSYREQPYMFKFRVEDNEY